MANRFKVTGGTNWNDTAGWAATSGGAGGQSFPVSGDAVTLDGSSNNLAVNVSSACSSLVTSTYAGTLSGSAALSLTGTGTVWDMPSGTLTYTGTITISDSSVTGKTFSGGDKTYSGGLVIAAGTGTVDFLGDNIYGTLTTSAPIYAGNTHIVVTGALTVLADVWDSDGLNVTCASLVSSGTTARTVTNIGTLTLTGTGTVLNLTVPTNLTWTAPSEVVVSDTSGATKTIAGGGQDFDLFTITGSGGAVTFTGDNTFNDIFTSGATPLVFTSTTQTFAADVVLTGCQSITGGTLSKASGTVTAPAGCIIIDNRATGGATFDGELAFYGGGTCTGWTGLKPKPLGLEARTPFGRHVCRYFRKVR